MASEAEEFGRQDVVGDFLGDVVKYEIAGGLREGGGGRGDPGNAGAEMIERQPFVAGNAVERIPQRGFGIQGGNAVANADAPGQRRRIGTIGRRQRPPAYANDLNHMTGLPRLRAPVKNTIAAGTLIAEVPPLLTL
jgi:hypothetical protein